MIANEEIIRRLVFHEGISLMPYKCPKGKTTIGVGRCVDENPFTKEEKKAVGDWKHGITKNAAFFLLRNDIERVTNECGVKIMFWEKLDSERQYALLDMAFNMGIGGLLKFKKMLKAMGVGNYKEAAKECLASQYAEETGKRAKRIAKVIETGKFEV